MMTRRLNDMQYLLAPEEAAGVVWDRLSTHGRGDAHHAAKPVLQLAFLFAHPRTACPSETILIRASTGRYATFPVILRAKRKKARLDRASPHPLSAVRKTGTGR